MQAATGSMLDFLKRVVRFLALEDSHGNSGVSASTTFSTSAIRSETSLISGSPSASASYSDIAI